MLNLKLLGLSNVEIIEGTVLNEGTGGEELYGKPLAGNECKTDINKYVNCRPEWE